MSIVNQQNPWIGAAGALNEGANSLAATLLKIPFLRQQLAQGQQGLQQGALQNQLLQGQVQNQPMQFQMQRQAGQAGLLGQQQENQSRANELAVQPQLLQNKLTSEKQQQDIGAQELLNLVQTGLGLTRKNTAESLFPNLLASIFSSKATGKPLDPNVLSQLTSTALQTGNQGLANQGMMMGGLGTSTVPKPADLVRLFGATANANFGADPNDIANLVPGIMQRLSSGSTGQNLPTSSLYNTNKPSGGTNWVWTPDGIKQVKQ